MAKDRVTEVRIHFLNSAPLIRPFFEHDLDLMINFNNTLNLLRFSDNSKVSEVAEHVDALLMKNKSEKTAA